VNRLLHKNPVSAFDGLRLNGVVKRTWLGGIPVSIEPPAHPRGRLISR
jgi:allantoinase